MWEGGQFNIVFLQQTSKGNYFYFILFYVISNQINIFSAYFKKNNKHKIMLENITQYWI